MSPPTYRSRLQRALSESVKRDNMVVNYFELVHKIRSYFLGCGTTYGPRSFDHIYRAVQCEVRANRIVWDSNPASCLCITDVGLRFYKDWGTIPLYDREDARMRYQTIRKIRRHTRILRDIVNEISESFIEFHPGDSSPENGPVLVATVMELYNSVDTLQTQNSDLAVQINFKEGEKRRLLNLVEH